MAGRTASTMSRVKLALAGVLIGAAFWWSRAQPAQAEQIAEPENEPFDLGNTWAETENTIYETTGLDMGGGTFLAALNTRGAPYRDVLAQTERDCGIPAMMLARLAYQESRFRADIISGEKVSSAGALGIMQIVPRWHPEVNPLDPVEAIRYAGKYLKSLFNQFGTWERALQAYNWGPGNLNSYLAGRITTMPTETINYSSQIMADIGSTYA